MAESSFARPGPVFRFAPSPNGRLHLGHALSALTNERMAQRFGGRLLLRIEDIDPLRCRPEFEQAIHDDLAWLGIAFDGAPRRQSEHFADYASALGRLQARGLVYPCFCSRSEVKRATAARRAEAGGNWPVDPDNAPLYPGTCRALAPDEAARRAATGAPHVLRLDMTAAFLPPPACGGEGRGGGESPGRTLTTPSSYILHAPPIPNPSPPQAGGRGRAQSGLVYSVFDVDGRTSFVTADPARWGDVVLARKDTPTSYHLSVVIDDALQGVSHVVRGRDLDAATDIHVVLQRLLGLATPLYHFHPLLLDEGGDKLAKSRGSEGLADLRERGVSAGEIRTTLGFG
jgi:glutamyl-Q tRNA(Asp) synthetase